MVVVEAYITPESVYASSKLSVSHVCPRLDNLLNKGLTQPNDELPPALIFCLHLALILAATIPLTQLMFSKVLENTAFTRLLRYPSQPSATGNAAKEHLQRKSAMVHALATGACAVANS